MKISEFIKGRNVSYDTVRRYINRNPEMFDGHIGKANNIIIDEDAKRILEEKYPFPEPVQVIQDNEAREKLREITEKYAAAMEKIVALTEQNAQLSVIKAKTELLEEENFNYREALAKLKREQEGWLNSFRSERKEVVNIEMILRRERQEAELMEERLEYKIAELERQLEQEKNKSWWAKLRRK